MTYELKNSVMSAPAIDGRLQFSFGEGGRATVSGRDTDGYPSIEVYHDVGDSTTTLLAEYRGNELRLIDPPIQPEQAIIASPTAASGLAITRTLGWLFTP